MQAHNIQGWLAEDSTLPEGKPYLQGLLVEAAAQAQEDALPAGVQAPRRIKVQGSLASQLDPEVGPQLGLLGRRASQLSLHSHHSCLDRCCWLNLLPHCVRQGLLPEQACSCLHASWLQPDQHAC